MSYKLINGIKCYNPESTESYINFPAYGFNENIDILEVNFWDRSRYRIFKNIIYQESKNLDCVKFLDVGCNNGMFIKTLLDLNKFEITGSEIYLKGLITAKKYIPEVEFIQLDITIPALDDNSYDLVTAFDVLEHIEKDHLAIENIFKLLKQGGKFIISVPQHKFMWSDFDEYLNHQRRYSKRELIEKLKVAGFKINYTSSFVFILFPLMAFSRLYNSFFQKYNTKNVANEDFNKKLLLPKYIDFIFDIFMKVDEFFIKRRISLPFGGTLLIIAEK